MSLPYFSLETFHFVICQYSKFPQPIQWHEFFLRKYYYYRYNSRPADCGNFSFYRRELQHRCTQNGQGQPILAQAVSDFDAEYASKSLAVAP